jgi:hypothetical protein
MNYLLGKVSEFRNFPYFYTTIFNAYRNCAPNIIVSLNKCLVWRANLVVTFIPRALPRAIRFKPFRLFPFFNF